MTITENPEAFCTSVKVNFSQKKVQQLLDSIAENKERIPVTPHHKISKQILMIVTLILLSIIVLIIL